MINITSKSEGFYILEAVCTKTLKVKRSSRMPNIITDIGLLRMGSNNDYMQFCRVGSGASTPQASDTQLQSQLGSAATASRTNGAQSEAPYYGWERRIYNFAVGSIVGFVGEIGVGWAATGATLFSRSRVLDGNGNPSSIRVQPDEFLRVSYEHRYYAPTFDTDSVLNIAGALGGSYQIKARASMASTATYWVANVAQNAAATLTAYEGEIGDITNQPTGLRTTKSIPAGSVSGTSAIFSMSAENANLNLAGGIRSVMFRMGNGCFQFQFTPRIPKDADSSLRLQFSHSWGRR